jgi:transcriptional regulator with PAS, ATPase and Fis domain
MSTTEPTGRSPEARGPERLHDPLHSGISRVLAALGAGLDNGAERNLPAIFEREVRQLVEARDVRLREVPARYQARLVTPTRSADAVVLGVPTIDERTQAVLEASLPAHRAFRDADLELLTAAAHLGGLVLEASRALTTPRARPQDRLVPMIGSSPVMEALREQVARVASTDFTVLIEGESGTGKELVARQIHEMSRRRQGPFVAVNCAAVVETLIEAELFGIEERTATGVRGRRGKFEHADGGTLFLDEVSDLSPAAQAKLLRVVQDVAVERVGSTGTKRVNTRIVVATNRPLATMVQQGQFRADLYFRLGGVEVHLPPLRARRDDVLELAQHFLAQHDRSGKPLTLSNAAAEAMRLYQWPGNVRELERLIERVVALTRSTRIELADLPEAVRGDYSRVLAPSLEASHTLRAWASRYASLVFERCGGNKRKTCRTLDVSYHTLQAYLVVARGADERTQAKRWPAWVRTPGTRAAARSTPES